MIEVFFLWLWTNCEKFLQHSSFNLMRYSSIRWTVHKYMAEETNIHKHKDDVQDFGVPSSKSTNIIIIIIIYIKTSIVKTISNWRKNVMVTEIIKMFMYMFWRFKVRLFEISPVRIYNQIIKTNIGWHTRVWCARCDAKRMQQNLCPHVQ